MDDSKSEAKPKKRIGRPPKSEIKKKTKGGRPVGRPKGDAAILNEYKARMLASPKSRKVLDTILNAALDDEHKSQAVAWKLVMDRILPTGLFEKSAGSSKPQIEINITGLGEPQVDANIIEAEVLEDE